MRHLLTHILLFCSVILMAQDGRAYAPSDIPNPHTFSIYDYVANPDGMLSSAGEARLNSLCAQADTEVEVEMVVVAIREMSYSYDVYDFAQTLFNDWGLGKKNKNTGVLILLVEQTRDIRIHTGGGMEGLLPDALCSEIIENTMVPLLRTGDWDAGLLAGAQAIYNEITTPAARSELLLGYQPKTTKAMDGLLLYLCGCFLALLFGSVWSYRSLRWNAKALNNIRYEHANQRQLPLLFLCILFPVPTLFLCMHYRKQLKQIRLQPIVCPECHGMMHRLSEAEEDVYLNGAQQAEERVKTMDYDVWVCNSCLNHLVLPYKQINSRYTRCPQCGALTYSQVSDVVLLGATTMHAGKGEKTYRCQHCGKQEVRHYVIPRLQNTVVVTGGSGHSGGGFSGGSFGGGMSFGGGASGRF